MTGRLVPFSHGAAGQLYVPEVQGAAAYEASWGGARILFPAALAPGGKRRCVVLLGLAMGACHSAEIPAISSPLDVGHPTGDRGPDWRGPGSDDAGPPNDSSPTDTTLGHAFGRHPGDTPAGVIFPTASQAERDAVTAAFYETWKSRYLESACRPGEYRVRSYPATGPWTVSEAHGYGMVFAAVMAGHDPQARALLDGLFAYAAGHPSGRTPALMSWAQDEGCADVEGNDSATDGDLDIAYALLLADRQWGSAGSEGASLNYLAQARRVIAAILAAEIHPQSSILLGDWVDLADGAVARAWRPGQIVHDRRPVAGVCGRLTGADLARGGR